jgi:hypothetical protein
MKSKSAAKSWDADAGKRGSLSSLDVLVRWLQAPGNYRRWQAEAKSPLTQEIVKELKQQGIASRSPVAVLHKVTRMEQQYNVASRWLEREGRLGQYHRGEADDDVHQGVLQRCPLYLELTPVFQNPDNQKAGSVQDVGEGDTAQEADAVASQEAKPVALPNAGEKRPADVLDTTSSLVKRVKHGATLADGQGPGTAMGQINAADDGQAFAEFHKASESRWSEYFGVEFIAHSDEAEEKMTEKLLQCRIEHLDAFAKVKLEAEQQRQDVLSRCTKVLARQQLRRGGVAEEDVDKVVPK